MQAIAVLADQVFHHASILQLHESHVCGGRDSLQHIGGLCRRLLPLGQEGPGAFRTAEIGNACGNTPSLVGAGTTYWGAVWLTCGGGDAGSSKDEEMLARPDPVRQNLGFPVNLDRGFIPLLFAGVGAGGGHGSLCKGGGAWGDFKGIWEIEKDSGENYSLRSSCSFFLGGGADGLLLLRPDTAGEYATLLALMLHVTPPVEVLKDLANAVQSIPGIRPAASYTGPSKVLP